MSNDGTVGIGVTAITSVYADVDTHVVAAGGGGAAVGSQTE